MVGAKNCRPVQSRSIRVGLPWTIVAGGVGAGRRRQDLPGEDLELGFGAFRFRAVRPMRRGRLRPAATPTWGSDASPAPVREKDRVGRRPARREDPAPHVAVDQPRPLQPGDLRPAQRADAGARKRVVAGSGRGREGGRLGRAVGGDEARLHRLRFAEAVPGDDRSVGRVRRDVEAGDLFCRHRVESLLRGEAGIGRERPVLERGGEGAPFVAELEMVVTVGGQLGVRDKSRGRRLERSQGPRRRERLRLDRAISPGPQRPAGAVGGDLHMG